MKKEIIKKHNKLIEANYKLTLQEQKLILTLAKEISREDKNFKKCVFTVEELSDILGINKKGYYSELKEITKSLISRVLQIKESNKFLQVSWLNSAEYFENEGKVELEFSEKLKPYLLQLGGHFTKLEFSQIVSLNSIYAIRIYELCKQYENTKQKYRILELKELKELLDVTEKSYNRYDNFKRRIILKAQEEINEKTDINITFEEIKTGRKVTSIKFKIKSKVKKKNYEKEIEERIRKQNKKLNENTFKSEKIENVKSLEEIKDELRRKGILKNKKGE